MKTRTTCTTFQWLALAFITSQAAAQADLAFEWGFLNGETKIQPINVQITSAKNSTEPYYMFTYPINSTKAPSLSTYGTGETNYMELAPYPPGTEIVMGMVDAFGNSGGWSNPYTVQTGTNNCTDSIASKTPITATLNTTEVGTCGTVGVTIENGKPPYTITVFPINSVSQTFNITSGSSDKYLAFVNNLGANLHLGFGIRDNELNWAQTAGPLWTFGTSQSCTAQSFTSSQIPSDYDGGDSSGPNNSPDDDSHHHGGDGGGGGGGGGVGAAVGGTVGGVAAVALVALALAWWFGWCCFAGKRRRQQDPKDTAAYDSAPTYDYSPQSTPGPNATLLHPYGTIGSTGQPSTGAYRSSTSIDTSHRPMSQVSTGYNQVGGFRLVNPDNADAQETLYPPTAAYAHPSHGTHGSNAAPTQPAGHSDQDASRRLHTLPTSPNSDGHFMEGFEDYPSGGSSSAVAGAAGTLHGGEVPPVSVSEKAAAMMAEAEGSRRRVHQHTDAGPAQQQDEEELPPAYAGIRPDH